ncbi:hypothetical protein [Aquimarina brevivitae]|uniref:Uncharacterized protein n=1 Tax=Aquimarina brevivitae TaxID=323412 RepID=A0A4Q7NXP8_9FLAO|nr:hypothetical protein [Aquimarina brevivitae]RZS92007.1 hypothetical protein EV197_3116 [Aquimarina brevivitae]
MKNRYNIKYFVLLIVIIGISYIAHNGFKNYQKNEIIKFNNTHLTFSDKNSKFTKATNTKRAYDFNKSLLDSIAQIKDSITAIFLHRTSEKIVFFSLDKDTLHLKTENGISYNYFSSLDKGKYDKDFNDLLVNALSPFLSKYSIKQIEIYTLTPTAYNNIPPPPGTLSNFDYEK